MRSAASDAATPDQEKALLRLIALRQMPPGAGKNSDENTLIDLDIEYEYKSIHLDMPVPGAQPADRREKHYVLKMNQMDKMLAAAQGFEDAELKKQIEFVAQNPDARMVQNWDQRDLNDLVKGKEKPSGPAQEKVASILQSHQEKMSELAKQSLEAEGAAGHAAKK